MAHIPVLLGEVLRGLAINPHGVYLDCTFGGGGHSAGILHQLASDGKLLALDRDLAALTTDAALQMAQDGRLSLHHCCFSNLAQVVAQCTKTGQIEGLLMDLGVCSAQLDTPQRGFSFGKAGDLDMRMDTSCGLTAGAWLQQVDEKTLSQVLFDFGEERYAKRIARAVIAQRRVAPITSTDELAAIVAQATPKHQDGKHPATRTFQAIRIKINNELDELKQGLQQALAVLKPGGRLAVISFHSLEDRIVKRFMRRECEKFNPGKLPIKESDIPPGPLQIIGKAIKPSALEVQANIRSRSAILRIAAKRMV